MPKLLSLIIHWRKPERRAAFGGFFKLLISALCETFLSTLLAPNLALLQAKFVIGTLMGRKVEWNAQDRGETSTTFREALQRHWPATLIGLAWTALLIYTVPTLIWWFSPVIAGFMLSIPLSMFTSRTSWGERARMQGLFLTPEELEPPDLLLRFQRELAAFERQPWSTTADGLTRVLREADAWRIHLDLLPDTEDGDPLRRNHLERLELKLRHEGPGALSSKDKRDLLLDRESLQTLHTLCAVER
jgi:membrane glycosyltransferase